MTSFLVFHPNTILSHALLLLPLEDVESRTPRKSTIKGAEKQTKMQMLRFDHRVIGMVHQKNVDIEAYQGARRSVCHQSTLVGSAEQGAQLVDGIVRERTE
jgi:hypothetical protein